MRCMRARFSQLYQGDMVLLDPANDLLLNRNKSIFRIVEFIPRPYQKAGYIEE